MPKKVIVLFEAKLNEDKVDNFLELAKELNSNLEQAEGFISVERFSSMQEENKFLSVTTWESEEAVGKWCANTHHHDAQEKGKALNFKDYKITVLHLNRVINMDGSEEHASCCGGHGHHHGGGCGCSHH